MKLLSWNINGIRAVYKSGFTSWLPNSQADIVCLQETKAKLNQLPWNLQFIPGYDFYLNPAIKKGYSGTGVFTKQKPQEVSNKLDLLRVDEEGRIQICSFPNFKLINVYVPNGSQDQRDMGYKMSFYEKFLELLSKIKDDSVILTGDFNIAHKEIDLAKPEQNQNSTMFTPAERQQIQNILDLGYADTFRMFNKGGGNYSWLSYYTNFRDNNIGWRIDYIFVSEKLTSKVKNAFILKDTEGSDHVPVGIDIDL
ncbi:MAG: exodeoxyribonuclease III [Patescibacteria group bacterium]|jgi:exodeoxyribonuclease-3